MLTSKITTVQIPRTTHLSRLRTDRSYGMIRRSLTRMAAPPSRSLWLYVFSLTTQMFLYFFWWDVDGSNMCVPVGLYSACVRASGSLTFRAFYKQAAGFGPSARCVITYVKTKNILFLPRHLPQSSRIQLTRNETVKYSKRLSTVCRRSRRCRLESSVPNPS